MSRYYNPGRNHTTFHPGAREPYRLSRSKIDLFLNCPRCFYLDRRLGVPLPPGFPFTLNSAVDKLLKREFDLYRARRLPHPLMKTHQIEAVPFAHEKLEEWRDAMRAGITYLHAPTQFMVTGGIDDLWINAGGELHVVDYKATAKNGTVNLDADWQIAYKRQAECYQWLFRKNGFQVSPIAYFVYCNGDADKATFSGRLEFDIRILPYRGKDDWMEPTLMAIKECLLGDKVPESGSECDFCKYREAVAQVVKALSKVKLENNGS